MQDFVHQPNHACGFSVVYVLPLSAQVPWHALFGHQVPILSLYVYVCIHTYIYVYTHMSLRAKVSTMWVHGLLRLAPTCWTWNHDDLLHTETCDWNLVETKVESRATAAKSKTPCHWPLQHTRKQDVRVYISI